MRILFDARSVRTPAGQYVFRGLTNAWHADPRVSAVLAALPPGFEESLLPVGIEPVTESHRGWLHHITSGLPRLATRSKADVIFVPNGLPPRDPRAVIYFQDLYHFEPFGEGISMRGTLNELARTAWRSYSAPLCRLAVPVSAHIRQHVVRRLHIPVVMIPNGVDVGTMRWNGGSGRVLIMGGRGARKNEDIAIRAWSQLPSSVRRQHPMDIIGVDPVDRRADLVQLARDCGVSQSVDIVGSIDREEFLDRIAGAALAVSCSRLEAFGLPVAEALALGAPVLASDIPSHRELIARAGVGTTVPAGDVGALARQLATALNGSPPRRLTSPPLGWSWRDRAREHVDAYLATA